MGKLFETIKIKKLMGIIVENEEVDRLLDKISSFGMNSLSDEEKKFLQKINDTEEETIEEYNIDDDIFITNFYNDSVKIMLEIGYDKNGWFLKTEKDGKGNDVPLFLSPTEKLIIAPYWNNKKIILISSPDKKYFFTEKITSNPETIGDLKGWIRNEFFEMIPDLIDSFEERFYVRV